MFLALALCLAVTVQAQSPSWHKYVLSPSTTLIAPKSVYAVSGNVTNPESLIASSERGPATLRRAENSSIVPTVILDFGQNVVGYPILSFDGASSNGPGIRLSFSETLEYLSNVSDFSRSYNGDALTPGSDQFVVPSKGPTQWTDTYGCQSPTTNQICADGLHGFRYIRLTLDALSSDYPLVSNYGEVNITSVKLNYTAYLGTPSSFSGFFECSNPNLTQFWFDAAYTNELVTDHFRMNDTDPRNAYSSFLDSKLVVFDGAKRDRDPYVGDLAVSALSTYLTHTDASIGVRNVLEDLIQHQRSDGWIPPASINSYTLPLFDYPLWWVVVTWEYVLYTGDIGFAQTYYPNIQSVLDGFYPSVTNSTSGLLSKGLNGTGGYGDYAFLPRTGEVTYYNALYVLALQSGSKIATLFNDTLTASSWTNRATSVSSAINSNLWDSSVGAYLDTTDDPSRHAQDGNGISIISGIANASQATSALTHLSNATSLFYGNAFMDNDSIFSGASQRVYAFISYFDIVSRFLTPGFDGGISTPGSALEEINRLYSWMANNDPTHTFWEGIGPNGTAYESGYTSMAHGWSTGVLPALTNYVLGIEPLEVGFRRWRVRPHLCGLRWARGRVGTPLGPIDVSWRTEDSGLIVEIDAPDGSVGEVSLAIGKGTDISLDGKQIVGSSDQELQGYTVVENIAGGEKHVIVVQ